MVFLRILLLPKMLLESFLIFAVETVRGLRVVKYGKRLEDKLNILSWYFLLSRNPHLPWNNISLIGRIINYSLSIFSEKTKCVVNGITFALSETSDIWVLDKSFEPWMDRTLDVKQGEVFLDLGAHIGKHTFHKARSVGRNGLVIAIEPHPHTYKVLLKSMHENNFSNIIAFNVAAWNTNCEMKLFIGKHSTLHSLKKSIQEQQGYNSKKIPLKVKAKRLDDIIKPLGVDIDWIKMDVEGAEIEALLGLKETLTKNHPNIIIETWESAPSELINLMKKFGYTLGNMITVEDGVNWIKAGVVSSSSTYLYFYYPYN